MVSPDVINSIKEITPVLARIFPIMVGFSISTIVFNILERPDAGYWKGYRITRATTTEQGAYHREVTVERNPVGDIYEVTVPTGSSAIIELSLIGEQDGGKAINPKKWYIGANDYRKRPEREATGQFSWLKRNRETEKLAPTKKPFAVLVGDTDPEDPLPIFDLETHNIMGDAYHYD